MRARSSLLRSTSSAPTFSCRNLRRFVPGIGTISSPCANTQASASCASVHFFSRAISPTRSTRSLIIEIDYIQTEPAQAVFACLAHVIWFPADSAKLRLGRVAQDSKFRRYDHLLAVPFQRAAKQLFIRVWSVHIRGVEERDAKLERAANSGERLFVIASAIKIRHPHAPETDRRDDQPAPSKFSLFHLRSASLRNFNRFRFVRS